MNAWIKRSDREPTKDETPVMYGTSATKATREIRARLDEQGGGM